MWCAICGNGVHVFMCILTAAVATTSASVFSANWQIHRRIWLNIYTRSIFLKIERFVKRARAASARRNALDMIAELFLWRIGTHRDNVSLEQYVSLDETLCMRI